MITPVGLVGVGAMGRALLNRLRLAHVDVAAYDIVPELTAAAVAAGATAAASPAEAARNKPLVHVFVVTDEEMVEVVTGRDGVLSGSAPGTILLLHSTIMPATTRHVADAAGRQGVRVVDAPITAVPDVVDAGNATLLVGGADDVVATVRPHLEALGKAVWHFGELGAGNVAKICKNMIGANERVALSETMRIAAAGGLDLTAFMEMVTSTDQRATTSRWKSAFTIDGNQVAARPSTHMFRKDIHLAAQLADVLGVEAPVTRAASKTGREWVDGWKKDGR